MTTVKATMQELWNNIRETTVEFATWLAIGTYFGEKPGIVLNDSEPQLHAVGRAIANMPDARLISAVAENGMYTVMYQLREETYKVYFRAIKAEAGNSYGFEYSEDGETPHTLLVVPKAWADGNTHVVAQANKLRSVAGKRAFKVEWNPSGFGGRIVGEYTEVMSNGSYHSSRRRIAGKTIKAGFNPLDFMPKAAVIALALTNAEFGRRVRIKTAKRGAVLETLKTFHDAELADAIDIPTDVQKAPVAV